MNLKKLFVMLAVLAVSATAFAGNSSSNAALFEQAVGTAAQDYEEEIDPQILKNTQQALTMGLLNFDARRDLEQMTDTDEKIQQLLEKTIPNILNKIKVNSDEVFTELEPLLGNLTDLLLKNQTIYPMSKIDKNTAIYVTMITSISYAEGQGLLLGKVSQILQSEMASAFTE